jgi:RNA polymerase sigma-70 factor (ECF subfamily)
MGDSTDDVLIARVKKRWGPPSALDAEWALVAGVRAGDEDAFLTLTRRHQGPMLRVARAYVSSYDTAEDVVQETWLAVLHGVERFEGRSSLKTWLYRILINRAKSAGQRDRRGVPDPPFAPPDLDGSEPFAGAERFYDASHPQWAGRWKLPPTPWECTVEDRVVTSELVGVVVAAINDLPPAQRLVVTLRDVECWTAQEVCGALGLSETNQRVILHRGRGKVRQRLESYHGSVDGGEREGLRRPAMPGAGRTGH